MLYLKTEFVKKIIAEISEAGQDAMIQVLPCYIVDNSAFKWRFQIEMEIMVALVPMDSHVKHKEAQY